MPANSPLTYRATVPAPIVPAMYVQPEAGTAVPEATEACVMLLPNSTAGAFPPDRKSSKPLLSLPVWLEAMRYGVPDWDRPSRLTQPSTVTPERPGW